jgi:hypothetical protein
MKALKGYVQNMALPKRSMAIGHAIAEAIRFCAKYIQQIKSTRKVWDDLNVDFKSRALCTFVLHNATIQPHGASEMNVLIAKSFI